MLATLLTICIVVFVYMHVVYQLKTSNDLEIFNLGTPDKIQLEEVCCMRQPILFDFWKDEFAQCIPNNFQYDVFDVNVVDNSGSILLCVEKAKLLFSKSKCLTERNSDFLKETLLCRIMEKHDSLLRPHMIARTQYDLIFGSTDACTKLRYSNWHRNYFLVASGEVTVKLAPPRNSRVLDVQKDSNDFYSLTNAWDAPKVKFLEFVIKPGQMVYIPAYWWYSFKLGKDASVLGFQYCTFMNVIAILPDIINTVLQQQNTIPLHQEPNLPVISAMKMETDIVKETM